MMTAPVHPFGRDSGSMASWESMRHVYYGVPVELMKAYFEELGAVESDEHVMQWGECQAVISRAEPSRVGALLVGGSVVEFSGCEDRLEILLEHLERKTLRVAS